MITFEQWENIKDWEKFIAIDENGIQSRCKKEDEKTAFVFAKGRSRYGHRYNTSYFLKHYSLKESKTDANTKWKKRLKRAIDTMEKSRLWDDILTVYKNLYDFVTLEEKERIYDEYINCDRYNRETGEQNYAKFVNSVKSQYPFMIGINEESGKEYIITDYIWEISECKLKSMYFGKYQNEQTKAEIAKKLAAKENCKFEARTNYDVTFSYDANMKRAWYSEEYKNCGNGHYYLAIDNNTAIFYEND